MQSADQAQLRALIAAHQPAAIEADYRNTLASASSQSGRHRTHPTDSIQIRFLTPDVALIDVASVNVGGIDATGTPMPQSRSQLFTIWQKRGGSWTVMYQRVVPAPTQ
jgi:hypothetical protein